MSKKLYKWNDCFSHVKDDRLGRSGFYVKDSRSRLFSYDGYMGGHEILDKIISICEAHNFVENRTASDSPMNISSSETVFEFQDGGFEMFGGNYMFGEPSQGGYVRGFNAFRWILCKLNIEQPRKFKNELVKLNCDELNERLRD